MNSLVFLPAFHVIQGVYRKFCEKLPDDDRAFVIFMGFYRACNTLKFSLGFQKKLLLFSKHYNENLLFSVEISIKPLVALQQIDKNFLRIHNISTDYIMNSLVFLPAFHVIQGVYRKLCEKLPDDDRAFVIFMGFYRVCNTLKFSLGFQKKLLLFSKHYNENLLCFQSLFFKDKQIDKIFMKAIFFLIEV